MSFCEASPSLQLLFSFVLCLFPCHHRGSPSCPPSAGTPLQVLLSSSLRLSMKKPPLPHCSCCIVGHPCSVHLRSMSLFWDLGSDLTFPKDPLGCSSLQVTLPPKKNSASTLKTSTTGHFKVTVLQLQSKQTHRLWALC